MRATSPPELRRRRILLAAVVIGAVAAIWILAWPRLQSPADEPEVALSGTQAQLKGRVLDAVSKDGLFGALVSIDHAGGRVSARADKSGRFDAVIDASRPIALTVDAPAHLGAVAFGRLCPGERRSLSVSLPPAATGTPPAPIVLEERCS